MRRSSAGHRPREPLAPDLDPSTTAKAYEGGGAAALSVLTDAPYFGGSVADLQEARAATEIPVLRKDFTIDEVQVYEARAIGADAILLIAAALPDDAVLTDLHALASELGMGVLVEAHDAAEIERALAAGALVVGVNSRDLATFAEDLGVAESLSALLPADVIAVAESAVRSAADAARMAAAGFDAVLVGEALVRADDPAALVRALGAAPVLAESGLTCSSRSAASRARRTRSSRSRWVRTPSASCSRRARARCIRISCATS